MNRALPLCALVCLSCGEGDQGGSYASPSAVAHPASASAVVSFGFQRTSVRGVEGVIVPARAGDPHEWTPTPADVEAFELGLDGGLIQPDGFTEEEWRTYQAKMKAYKRQYKGRFDGASRTVEALLMCRQPEDWTSRLIVVDGGLDCYADVIWNASSSRYHLLLRFSPAVERFPPAPSGRSQP